MKQTPPKFDGHTVICYTAIDSRHRHTRRCKQIVAGELMGPAAGVAICQYKDESGYYLFGCDAQWRRFSDTYHLTLEEAKHQAEFEYEGVSGTWQTA